MKILYISHSKNIGGADRSLLTLIDKMLSMGNEIIVLTKYKKGRFYDELKYRKLTIITEDYFWWASSKESIKDFEFNYFFKNQNNMLIGKKIAMKLKKEKLDLIHTNVSVVNIGYIISYYLKIPHIWHIREYGEKDHNLIFELPEEIVKEIFRQNLNNFIFISKDLMNYYKKRFSLNNNVKVVYNGFDNTYRVTKKKYRQKLINIALVSNNILPNKGQLLAVKALTKLAEKGYSNLKLYIPGNMIDNDYMEQITKAIKKNKLESYIKFTGLLNHNELIDLRKNIDIELMCSKNEAFGRVTVEAMLAQNPVIGSKTGGTKEIIIDGYNGFFYNYNNINSLANKIELLINDRKLLKKLGRNAYYFAKRNFSSKTYAENVYNYYLEVLNK